MRTLILALTLALSLGGLAGCFKPQVPDVAFTCGPDGGCPDDYECRVDGCCHRLGSSLDEHGACGEPAADAAVLPDALPSADASP
jgi:hypothetical protein